MSLSFFLIRFVPFLVILMISLECLYFPYKSQLSSFEVMEMDVILIDVNFGSLVTQGSVGINF